GTAAVTQELEASRFTGLLDVKTGELLEPTVDNAARVIESARAMKSNVNEIVKEATAFLVEVSTHRGTKTLHGEHETVTLSGGTGTDYDAGDLMELLADAGCPEERINAAVTATVTYKVDRAVLRQLAAANPDYRAAIELAAREIEKPYSASVTL